MITVNFENVNEAGANNSDFPKPPAGGYKCEIKAVENKEKNNGLVLDLDICEGKYEYYFTDKFNHFGWWALTSFHSYKPKALPFFKRFLKNLQKSNPQFEIALDGGSIQLNENDLIGLKIGVVFGYEEYIGNDGKVKEKTKVADVISLDDLRNGKYKVPEKVTLPKPSEAIGVTNKAATTFEPVSDDDCIF